MALNLIKVCTVLISLFAFVSCGSNSASVTDVELSASNIDNDVVVDLSADLSIGALSLPNASLPIYLPKIGKEIGTVSLLSDGLGTNTISVQINVSEAANLDLQTATLPNGMAIPLIAQNSVLKIELNSGIEIMLSLAENAQAIAVVVPISTFDQVGEKVGTASLIPSFNLKNINGAAGIFLSKAAGQNGIALAIDLSSVLGDIEIPNATVATKSLLASEASLDLSSITPSRRVKRKIDREMLKLHKRSTQLEL